jgi:hydrogenase-4 component E
MSAGGVAFTIVTLHPGHRHSRCIYLAIKKVAIRREVEPIVGYHASILAGLLLIVGATFASHQVRCALQQCQRPAAAHGHPLLVAGMFCSWPGAMPSPWCWATS